MVKTGKCIIAILNWNGKINDCLWKYDSEKCAVEYHILLLSKKKKKIVKSNSYRIEVGT